MNAWGGVALYLLSAASGLLLAQCLWRSTSAGASTRVLTSLLGFFGTVIGSFLVCGWLQLAGAGVRVSTTHAAVVAAAILAVAAMCSRSAGLRADGAVVASLRDFRDVASATWQAEPRWLVRPAILLWFFLMLSAFVVGHPRGSEASAYHLFNGVSSLQTESLRMHDRMFLSGNPANVGLWYAGLLSWLPERFTALAQLPFLPALGVAAYLIARQLGADRSGAAFAALGLLSLPVITLHALQAESDTIGLTLLAIALHLVLASDLPARRFAAAGVAIGLAFGVKALYLIGGGLIFMCVWMLPVATSTARLQLGRWRAATLLAVAAFAIGGFWLLRNFLETGNPLYPIYVRGVFDVLGWPGAADADYAASLQTQFFWVQAATQWPAYPWTEWHYASAGTHYKGNAGMGAFWAAAVPAAWIFSLLVGARQLARGRADLEGGRRLVMLAAGTVMVVAWFVLGDRQPRYATTAWIFLLPLVGTMLTDLPSTARRAVEVAFGVTLVWMMASFALLELVELGDRVVYSRQFQRHQYYEYAAEIDRLPAGSKILNLESRTANYPLSGAGQRNRVVNFVLSVRQFGIEANPKGWDVSIEKDTKGIRLTAAELKALGVTHIWMRPTETTSHDACLQLIELARLDRNPVSKVAIAPPKVLFEARYCD